MRALLHPELREAQRRRLGGSEDAGSERNIWTTQELVLAITETGVVAVLTLFPSAPMLRQKDTRNAIKRDLGRIIIDFN